MSKKIIPENTINKQKGMMLDAIKRIRKFYKDPMAKYPMPFYINDDKKILVLSPHPDDESIGCGGILLQYPSHCRVVCLTDGRFGDKQSKEDEIIKLRESEFKSAMQFIGVDNYSLLKITDTELCDGYDEVEQIGFDNIDYIFIPNVFDQHPDHQAIGNHIKRLIEYGVISEDVMIAQYEVWNALTLPTHYLDISKDITKKKELICRYIEQIKHIDYHERIVSLNYFRGMGTGVEYAECYLVLDALVFLNAMS